MELASALISSISVLVAEIFCRTGVVGLDASSPYLLQPSVIPNRAWLVEYCGLVLKKKIQILKKSFKTMG